MTEKLTGPHLVVAGCAVRERKLLLGRRSGADDPWRDHWEFPGGKVTAGEDPPDALRREWGEELSARILVGRLLPHVSSAVTGVRHFVVLGYTIQIETPEASWKLDPRSLLETRWFSPGQVAGGLGPLMPSTLVLLRALVAARVL